MGQQIRSHYKLDKSKHHQSYLPPPVSTSLILCVLSNATSLVSRPRDSHNSKSYVDWQLIRLEKITQFKHPQILHWDTLATFTHKLYNTNSPISGVIEINVYIIYSLLNISRMFFTDLIYFFGCVEYLCWTIRSSTSGDKPLPTADIADYLDGISRRCCPSCRSDRETWGEGEASWTGLAPRTAWALPQRYKN